MTIAKYIGWLAAAWVHVTEPRRGMQMRRSTLRAMIVAPVFCASVSAVHAQQLDGVWSGSMQQALSKGERTSYPVRLVVSGLTGETRYATLACTGRLEFLGTANGQTVFSETIVEGRFQPGKGRGCVDGFYTLLPDGDKLMLAWTGIHSADPVVATGVLERVPMPPREVPYRPRPTGECEKYFPQFGSLVKVPCSN